MKIEKKYGGGPDRNTRLEGRGRLLCYKILSYLVETI